MPPKTPQTPEEWNEYDAAHPGADPLADARITLEKANEFGANNNSARLAALPDSLAGLHSAADTRGTGRKITEGLSAIGGHMGTAGMLASPIQPEIGVPMMTAGGLMRLPDYLRREVMGPDANEAPVGPMDRVMAAVDASPIAFKGLSSLRGLKGAAQAGDTTGELHSAWDAAKDVPYRAGGSVTAQDAPGMATTAGSALPDSWKPFVGAPTPKPAYVHPPYQSLPKGVDSVADTLGPLDSHTGQAAASIAPAASVPSEGLAALQRAIATRAARPRSAPGYQAELGRAMNARPTPNATAVFDKMSSNGEFGPEMQGFTNRQYNIDLTDELNAIDNTPSQGLANILHQQEAMTDQANSSTNPHEALAILKRLAER